MRISLPVAPIVIGRISFFVVTFIALVLSSCALTPTKPNEKKSDISVPLKNDNSSVKIIFSAPEHAWATLRLMYDDNDKYQPLGAIELSGENCVGGFQAKLNYSAKYREFRYHYFDRQFPWGARNEIILKRLPDDNLSVDLNGESVTVKMSTLPRFVRIEMGSTPINIEKIETDN